MIYRLFLNLNFLLEKIRNGDILIETKSRLIPYSFLIARFLRKVTCNALKTLRLISSSVLEAILKQDGTTNEFKDCFVLLIDVSTVFRFNQREVNCLVLYGLTY